MFDRSMLNPYAAHALDRFFDAFPQEITASMVNSEDFYTPREGFNYKGGWIIEWLCPVGCYDWNVRLHCADENRRGLELILRWGSDHDHFGKWGREGEPEIDECCARMADIFAEKVWHCLFFRGDEKYGSGSICRPDQLKKMIQYYRATWYEIKSWRGTFNQEVHLDTKAAIDQTTL